MFEYLSLTTRHQRNNGPTLLPILGRKPNPNKPGIPIDVSRANMFDTTYVPPLVRNSMLLWEYYQCYVNSLLWISSGTTNGMDQWVGEVGAQRHHVSKSKHGSINPTPYRLGQG